MWLYICVGFNDLEDDCRRGCGVKLLNYVEEDWLVAGYHPGSP